MPIPQNKDEIIVRFIYRGMQSVYYPQAGAQGVIEVKMYGHWEVVDFRDAKADLQNDAMYAAQHRLPYTPMQRYVSPE